ncbi:DUF4367 domain-containing protein [Lachnospiraceae bacterium]|nr:DUF4367 domain-containing protein [Lachnospiraceae bacterium]
MDNMDLLLKEAFEEMVTEEYENRPLEFPEHRFSLRFRIKMRRLMNQIKVKKEEREDDSSLLELYRPIHSRKRLLLMIALLLLLLGGTVVAAKTLISWLYQVTLEQREDHVKVNRYETAISENETAVTEGSFQKYKLTKIPEGYELMESRTDEIFKESVEIYKNSEGYLLLLRQNGRGEITMGNVTSDKTELKEVNVKGFEGYYVEDCETANLILSDGEYLIEIFANLSKEELVDLAEGLESVQ